jgi:hypothetical protein
MLQVHECRQRQFHPALDGLEGLELVLVESQRALELFEEQLDLPRKLPLKKQLSQRQSAEL